jgi:hypothetical protein
MNRNIRKFSKANPITSVWIETGDPRQPLTRVWVDARRNRSSAVSAKTEVEGIGPCASLSKTQS